MWFTFLSFFLTLGCSVSGSEADVVESVNLKLKAQEALAYCKTKSFNAEYCILIDYSLHSGKKRMFIYDFKGDSVLASGMVSHGCGKSIWGQDNSKTNPVFSNEHESHCSSLGKYKVGNRGYSSWGIHVNYKLHGLDKTNSNAYDRTIVLHSWEMISHTECYPSGTPEGWGCPAVSNDFMTYLDALLQKSKKPTLMWVFN